MFPGGPKFSISAVGLALERRFCVDAKRAAQPNGGNGGGTMKDMKSMKGGADGALPSHNFMLFMVK